MTTLGFAVDHVMWWSVGNAGESAGQVSDVVVVAHFVVVESPSPVQLLLVLLLLTSTTTLLTRGKLKLLNVSINTAICVY